MNVGPGYVRNVQEEKEREELGQLLGQMDAEHRRSVSKMEDDDAKLDTYLNITIGIGVCAGILYLIVTSKMFNDMFKQ